MEIYYEQNVENPNIDKHRKRTTVLSVLRYVILVLGILLAILIIFQPAEKWRASMVIFVLVFGLLSAAPFVATFFLLGRFLKKSNTEYDYRLDNGTFRVIKVVQRNYRKLMAVVPISTIESVGRINCDAYERYNASKDIKKLFAICHYDKEEDIVYLRYRNEGEDFLLHIEPDEELIAALKKSLSRLGIIDKSLHQPIGKKL